MFRADSRFCAVTKDQEQGSFLFARLRQPVVEHPVLEVLDSEKAYQASISKPPARIAGCGKLPTKELIYLLLSIPKTTATISRDELQLRCIDKSAVQLFITLPVTPIPAKGILQALHSGLMLAAASLEGTLLEIVGADMRTEIAEATRESLEIFHGPLIAGGQPVESRPAFRRLAAADARLHAARAFAVAEVAENVREEILGKRKERQDRENRKRERERERVREAKRLMSAGQRAKRPQPSLFDIENDSPNPKAISTNPVPKKAETRTTQSPAGPTIPDTGGPSGEDRCRNPKVGTAMRATAPDGIYHVTNQSDRPPRNDPSVQRELGEPRQRKKKRKIRKLV